MKMILLVLGKDEIKMAHYFQYPPEYVEDLSNIDWELVDWSKLLYVEDEIKEEDE